MMLEALLFDANAEDSSVEYLTRSEREVHVKALIVVGMAALLATAGGAKAGDPIALGDAELDRVTAGTHVNLEAQIKAILETMPDSLHDVMKVRLERLSDIGHPAGRPE